VVCQTGQLFWLSYEDVTEANIYTLNLYQLPVSYNVEIQWTRQDFLFRLEVTGTSKVADPGTMTASSDSGYEALKI
jgi:hypothetical protein